MFFSLAFICSSAALVTQAEKPAVIEVQPGGAATLPCGIPVIVEVSWFSLQSDHIPARVTDLKFKTGYDMDLTNIGDEYRGRLTPIFTSTHSLQLKNITEADLLIYCCIQITGLKFGNCTKLNFTDPPQGQSTPHPLQHTTPQPETLNPQPCNPDLLPWILLPVALLTGSISSLCCYFCHNQVPLRKSSDSQQRGSRTSQHNQEEHVEVQYVSVKLKSPKKRDQKRAEDGQDTVYAGIK